MATYREWVGRRHTRGGIGGREGGASEVRYVEGFERHEGKDMPSRGIGLLLLEYRITGSLQDAR